MVDSGSASISRNMNRRAICEESAVVHNLIERCLRLYMNKNEVVETLLCLANIEPGFTTSVLQRLEEENAEFFKSYYVRVKLNKQIQLFNDLLKGQSELLNSSSPQKVPLLSMRSGIHCMPVNNPPLGYPILQQPSIPFMSQSPSYFVNHMPSCQAVHRIPSPGNFNPTQINYVEYCATNTVPSIPTCSTNLENRSSSALMASCGQVPFTLSAMAGLGMETPALNATNNLHVANVEGLQLGSDGQTGPPKELQSLEQISWNSSVSDIDAGWPTLPDVGAPGNYSGGSILPYDEDVLLD
ncbi:uncharacterized protein LOC122312972 isoform X2 [Carya illinoinensis]|uniref:Uncharacterized protein n=2 Tax=Carya illinoinensis TaxID=32201 RepID=A0A8T1PZF1_CARIL|nr:uncharacterized protein LOC122312972 isoform X2 [Carya illinoinensis]XP_042983593.1 uncharacterized protein LOC122312972 isoform X2 [Carya illinoinensis]XP_042983594.1 uncharacterized protein LOC122312972 isoform X2 [Carya illinoinensis]KAG6649928.1 hypothetical protein CIPAW_06G008300 [Carya illinoinensis]KAG6649929.1 hypothetical protein CIPAW_06G008300 [Carya illinoinensis]KAG6649930.1 hypothetical protein CIPAW_06G008300 [Carya illinoinensis]